MIDVARARRAVVAAITDVEPAALNERLESLLTEESVAPAALTFACGPTSMQTPGTPLAHRAAGVQLIYSGLRLTRALATTEPWTAVDTDSQADLDILAADVLVARGFDLLAQSPAAAHAVQTVQTVAEAVGRRTASDSPSQLERAILELAVIAGTTVQHETPDRQLQQQVRAFARSHGYPLPPADQLLAKLEDGTWLTEHASSETPAPSPDD